MKRNKGIFLVLITIMLSILFNSTTFAKSTQQTSIKRYIVKFKDSNSDKSKLINKHSGKIRHQFNHFDTAVADFSEQSLEEIKKDTNIEYVEEDKIVSISEIASYNWAINSIKAPSSWQSGLTGKGVKIAVIDTGAGPHPDLSIFGGANTIKDSNTESYADDNGHGTHVAGIIGAQGIKGIVKGVAPEAAIYAVKALDSSGDGYTSDIISGIDWAIDNGMDIINMSLGSSDSNLSLKNAIDTAYNQGLLIVAAAGNVGNSFGTGENVEYPANYSSAIAVGAIDSTNTRASFSSTGSKIEVSAPGVNIVSTYLNGRYARMSGTSMATPFVTGDLALLKQEYPNYTNTQLRQLLNTNVVDLGTKGRDSMYGYGLINTPVKTAAMPASVAPTMASSGYTYESQAKALHDLGLFNGISTKEYTPDLGAAMDRQTAIVMILRLVGKIDVANSITDIETIINLAKFEDASLIQPWARKPMAYAVENGLVLGTTDSKIKPNMQLTGQMFSAIILRNIGYEITAANYEDSSSIMVEKGGLTVPEAIKFNSKNLIRDDMVGMSYGSLNLHYVDTGKTIIQTLVDEGTVSRALVLSLGLAV